MVHNIPERQKHEKACKDWFGWCFPLVMAPKSTERAQYFLNQQRWLLFLSFARNRDCVTVKKLRSDHHKGRDPQCMPATSYLQQQANVCALAGLKIESSPVEKPPLASNDSVSAPPAGAVSGATHCADTSDMLKLREYMRELV
ncbi:histone acetyltransferase HAC12-like [Raphanus sativus]|nr:histone acetyltransferase HAC12-like [Raphanus sativus]